MKAPKNYYNVVDQKKLGLDQIDKNAAAIAELQDLPILPAATPEDEGKVVKVGSDGDYELGTDENTHIVANPDAESTERLDKLTIGSTTYLVNEDVMPTVIKAVRLVINSIHGSDQNVAIRRLRMKNTLTGDYYQFGGSDACTCSTGDNVSQLIDNGTFDEVYVASSKLPFSIDVNFEDGIDITQYNEFGMICSPYENASPLSVEVLVSADGENFIEAGSNSNVGFTYQAYVPFYKFGDVDIKIPDYTSADRGKFLGIDNTDHVVWENVSASGVEYFEVDYDSSLPGYALRNGKKVSDIFASINNGKLPVMKIRNASSPSFPNGLLHVNATNDGIMISMVGSDGTLYKFKSANNTQSTLFTAVT